MTKNTVEMNKIINSYLKGKKISSFIKALNAGTDKQEVMKMEENIDYNKIINMVFVDYHDNLIKNNKEFAEISYQVIRILKENKVNLSSIKFTEERENKVYELHLKEEEMDKESEEISDMIKRIK